MRSKASCLVVFAVCASTTLAFAQLTPSPTESAVRSDAANTAVAYVYVSNHYNIRGYFAASTGVLTPIPGTPYPSTIGQMALNGKWLFGIDANDDIESLEMASNGSIKKVDTYVSLYSPDDLVDGLFLDHTGATLYDDVDDVGNYYHESLKIDQSTGQLTFISSTGSDQFTPSFIGNNTFAYSSSCYRFPSPDIYIYKRNANGALNLLSMDDEMPPPPPGLDYCPQFAAADPSNHIVVPVQQYSFNTGVFGPIQLATYTADQAGNLTTTSTYENMPTAKVAGTTGVNDLAMSTGGAYLAVTGPDGLQVFHFNGAKPITNFTTVLSGTEVNQASWDKYDHLYVISSTQNELYVFNVSAAGVTPAKGSPYAIPDIGSLVVLPK